MFITQQSQSSVCVAAAPYAAHRLPCCASNGCLIGSKMSAATRVRRVAARRCLLCFGVSGCRTAYGSLAWPTKCGRFAGPPMHCPQAAACSGSSDVQPDLIAGIRDMLTICLFLFLSDLTCRGRLCFGRGQCKPVFSLTVYLHFFAVSLYVTAFRFQGQLPQDHARCVWFHQCATQMLKCSRCCRALEYLST